MSDNGHLRKKIDEAKRQLPLPELMDREGLGEHAKKNAHCPFLGHKDKHKSFSVFKGDDGSWHWKCHAGCGDGDEIMFLRKLKGLSLTKAMNLYLDMAGFPSRGPRKSHEYPSVSSVSKSRESLSVSVSGSPKCHVFLVSPVSNGQGLDGEKEKVLKALAARNACTEPNTARKRRFKLVRDLKAIEKGIGRELDITELMPAFDEWHRLSQPFLDPAKTRDDYLAAFLAELGKVRVPTGEGTLAKALENVSKLSLDQLPAIPGYANAPEKCRRLMALHRELHRLSSNGTYFLAYRVAAKSCKGLSHQEAHTITVGVLVRYGVVKIVSKGEAGLNGTKAAVFQYLLPEPESVEADDDEIPF